MYFSVTKILTCVCSIPFQVVPFVAPTSNEKAAVLKENKKECSEKNLEDTADSLQISHSSLIRDQQLNHPKLEGGRVKQEQ